MVYLFDHVRSYGPRGSAVILKTLYKMFPLESMDPKLASPLSRADLLSRVVLQEAAAALIMDDLHMSREEALMTLRDSGRYGAVQFPE